LDIRLQLQQIKLGEYEKKGDNRNIKKSLRIIEKIEKEKQTLLYSYENKENNDIRYLLKLDVCNNIDCEYLHKYKMNKNEKFNKTYSLLCLNITELFKGIVWMNMYSCFKRVTNPYSIPMLSSKIDINLDIRNIINSYDIIFIPDRTIYKNDLFYENNTLDQRRKNNIKKRFILGILWYRYEK